MGEVKTINPFSMDNIDINELSKQQERIMMTDDVVVVLNGHLQHTRFLEKERSIRLSNLASFLQCRDRLIFALTCRTITLKKVL